MSAAQTGRTHDCTRPRSITFPLAPEGPSTHETLEVVPRHWKALQHVRQKFTCLACEAISQAPLRAVHDLVAPHEPTLRGWYLNNACPLLDKLSEDICAAVRRAAGGKAA
jgi:hypothetical protein